ncbi:DUF2169 domain-containing protein [Sorangium sp. So ce269]
MDLISECALGVAKVGWQPRHGGFAITVVCKATFELRPEISPLAAAQEPVVEADVYTGEGGCLALASELSPFKQRPEVLVSGHAYAPEGRPVPALVARLAAGEIDKAIQVVGDRYFGRDGWLGEPAHFTAMPLVWARAAGGPDTLNPAGRPLGSEAWADFSGRVPAPNLLPVGLRLAAQSDVVPPVGFGPIAPAWPSRAACLHRHAASWNPSRWHERPLPEDIDPGYFNAAPPDQQRTLPFGEEALYLENLHPRFARLSTRLAPVTPAAAIENGSGAQRLPLRCDTLVIDTDRGLAMLLWRAHVLLDRADRPGRVVVTGPGAPDAAPSARDHEALDVEGTLMPGTFLRSSIVLPFSGAAARASSSVPPLGAAGEAAPASAAATDERPSRPSMDVIPPALADDPLERTEEPGLTASPAMLPFTSTQGQSAPQRDVPPWGSASGLPFVPPSARGESESAPPPQPWGSASGLPFVPPSARGEGNGAHSSRPPELQGSTPPPAPHAPWGSSSGSPAAEAQSPPASGWPWDAPPSSLRHHAPLSAAAAEPLPPSLQWPPATVTPQASYRAAAYMAAAETAAQAERWFAPASSPAGELPTPPPLLGALATVSATSADEPATGWSPAPAEEADAKDAPGPAAEPAPDVAFEAYPPERCGAIAARLACDKGSTGDVLRAEDLDEARWQRVHAHWLDRICDEAARSRKQLLSDYDGAYVAALEAMRGPITVEDYARLAEAAERSAIEAALAERGLPEGAWPRIHRVWIARMVKDVRLGKQIRSEIDTLRAAI